MADLENTGNTPPFQKQVEMSELYECKACQYSGVLANLLQKWNTLTLFPAQKCQMSIFMVGFF